MDREQIKRIIDDTKEYDDGREDSFSSMIGEFYNRRMLSTVIVVWAAGLTFIGVATVCAVLFFMSAEVKTQIMYAALFIVFIHFLGLMKIFAWQIIHRNSLKREIKRLELRTSELAQALTAK
jgi:hypothetical protein